MGYHITNEEQETIILFNESDGTAHVSTFNKGIIRKLASLCEERPAEAYEVKKDHDENRCFVVPKKWIKINPSRILSDEIRNERSERMKAINSNSTQE